MSLCVKVALLSLLRSTLAIATPQRGYLRRTTLGKLCLSFFLAAACLKAAVGQEPTLEQAHNHIVTMFQAERDLSTVAILKWTVPIRYVLIGANDRARKAYAQQAMALSHLINLDIAEYHDGDEKNANVYFVFTSDLVGTAKEPLLKSAFKNSNETEEEYAQRVSSFDKQPLHQTFYWGKTSIKLYVSMLDPRRMSFDVRSQMLYLFFTTLVPVYSSDVIRPSIMNGHPTAHELSSTDVRLLRAIYSKEIRFGMSLSDALPILEAAVTRADQ